MTLNINLTNLGQSPVSCDSSESGNSKNLNNDNEQSVINSIFNAAKNSNTLGSCLSAINSVLGYLSHKSETVRKVAVEVIVSLVVKAAELLSKETDPNKITQAAGELFKVFDKLNELEGKGAITLNQGAKSSLSRTKEEILKKLAESTELNQDTFLSSQNKENSDQFISSAKQTNNNSISPVDKFVSSLDSSINRLEKRL